MLLKGARVIDPQVGIDGVMDVLVDGGLIAEVSEAVDAPEGCEVVDCAGKVLVPGLVDMHVHFRDPGFEYKEDIASGVRAATHGGFTDVATMPNTDPVTDTGTAVRYQIDRGADAGLTRVHPIGALTRGEDGESLAEIGDMVMEGACGFSDDGHGVQSAGMMRTCMEYVSQFDRAVIAHCEDESLTANGVVNEGRASTRLGMFGWPALGEELEVMRDIELCRLTGCPLHVAHISTARSLDLVRAAKAEGLPVTCEVTPHHLFLTEENITDSYNTNLKVNPPLRTRDDAEALVAGLADPQFFESYEPIQGYRLNTMAQGYQMLHETDAKLMALAKEGTMNLDAMDDAAVQAELAAANQALADSVQAQTRSLLGTVLDQRTVTMKNAFNMNDH